MTERYSFTVDGGVVWNQDNIDTTTLTDTINESYATAEEDSPTRYLSVLDTTSDMSLDNLNITLSNPKLEVDDAVETYTEEILEQPEENNDQVVVFSVEGSDELFGIQIVQDEEGNLQKYQFQFKKNEDGQLEAIPETITLIPMDEDPPDGVEVQESEEYAQPIEERSMHIFVQEDNSHEHILPDNHIEEEEEAEQEMEEHQTMLYEDEAEAVEEETMDVKPGLLHVNVKQEIHEHRPEYVPEILEPQTFTENLENEEIAEFPEHIEEQPEPNFEYHTEEAAPEENSMSSEATAEYQEKQPETEETQDIQEEEFEHVEVNPDMNPEQLNTEEQEEQFQNETTMNDSDENEYEIVEGLHITGDIDEQIDKQPSNILRHALKSNKDSPKIVKKDNKLYLYVVQHPEKENVDSLSLELSNLCTRPKANPRSILKSSHTMFQTQNEIETNSAQDERLNKRFARCKETVQAMLFHNFINKTTIPQAPVRKNRLPRKQKIKPVERMDEEIVVQEVMVSNNGFVEAVNAGVNKENLAITEYVELTDSDDDYDPKKITRKKKKHRRKRIEITISDDSDASHDSVIELTESDDEAVEIKNNNNTPPKRRRGRPPKNKPNDSPSNALESPAKKTKIDESLENPTKPEIPCPKCNKTFPSQNSLKTHLQHHNLQSSIKRALPEYKYKCEKCATTFINNILLKKHMCSKLFNCNICKRKFTDLTTLNWHKRTHAKEQMVKSTAVAQVSPKKPKPANVEFKCPKIPSLKCKTCGKLCSSTQNLNIHMKTHKEFVCSTCAKIFVSQLLLEKHLRESCVKSPHQGRRSMRIKSVGNLENKTSPPKRRLKSMSSPVKKGFNESRLVIKEKCEVCSIQFNSYQALFKHKVAKHGLETPDKSVFNKKEGNTFGGGGVPAAKRLHNAYAGLNCTLDFNE